MADQKHVELLRRGVLIWNRNRPQDPALAHANFTRADLSGADLRGAELTRANLSEATLAGAYLNRAGLIQVDLTLANLQRTTLAKADLSGADLTGADLTMASLSEATLTGVHLNRADLSHADLTGTNLTGTIITGADLSGATLHRSDLTGAKLVEVDLAGADLTHANLTRVDLSGADLSGAKLTGATLTEATLAGSNLTKAISSRTAWINLDLRGAQNLDTIRHFGPASVGIDTLYKSEGQIPPEFLRGCGAPDYFVGLVPGLTATAAITHHAAFISYNHTDDGFADRLYKHLFHRRKIPVWQDKHEVRGGDLIMDKVDQAIRVSDRVILLCSEASLNSWWIDEEIERWTEKERELREQAGTAMSMVIPVDLDGHLWDSQHRYAATIRRAKVLDGRDRDVNGQIERALRVNEVGPFDLLRKAGNPDAGGN